MLIEKLIVGAIVAGAVLWSGSMLLRAWRGKGRCGCGGSKCPAAREADERALRVIDLHAKGSAAGGDRPAGARG